MLQYPSENISLSGRANRVYHNQLTMKIMFIPDISHFYRLPQDVLLICNICNPGCYCAYFLFSAHYQRFLVIVAVVPVVM